MADKQISGTEAASLYSELMAGMSIRQPCPAPAPLVVNGGGYVGCQLPKGHDGKHAATIEWSA